MQEEDDLLNDFGDLLGDAPAPQKPVAPAPQKPVAPAPQKPVAPAPNPAPQKQNDSEMVPFGTKISTIPIPRFKATKAIKSRISFLTNSVLPVKTHYVEGIGAFQCFDGKCCELEGLPRVRYLAPVVVYETDKTGKVISPNISVQALCLGEDAYSALGDAINFSGKTAKEVDVIISCSDEAYQKLSFTVDNSQAPTWKTFPTAKSIVEFYKANSSKLYMAVARRIEESTYLTRKGFVTPNSQAPQVDNPEDLLD